MNLVQIAKSWYQFTNADQETRALMQARLSICNGCEHKEMLNSLGQTIVQAVDPQASIYRCAVCKCPLAPLTAHPGNACKDGRWGVAGT